MVLTKTMAHDQHHVSLSCPPDNIAMGIDLGTEQMQFLFGGFCCCAESFFCFDGKPRAGFHLLQCDPRVQADDLHPLRGGVIAHHCQVGYHPVGPRVRRQPSGFPCPRPGEIARSGKEIHLFYKSAFVVVGHRDDIPAEAGEVVSPATARQPDFRFSWSTADVSAVEVAEGIDLGAAKEGVVHHAPLTGFHNLGHAAGHQAFVKGSGIAHGNRHRGQDGSHATCFKEDDKVGSMRLLSEHSRRTRTAGADSDRPSVFEQPGGTADHQFHGVIIQCPES